MTLPGSGVQLKELRLLFHYTSEKTDIYMHREREKIITYCRSSHESVRVILDHHK